MFHAFDMAYMLPAGPSSTTSRKPSPRFEKKPATVSPPKPTPQGVSIERPSSPELRAFSTFGVPFAEYREMPRIHAAVDIVTDYLAEPTPAQGCAAHIDSKLLNTHLIVISNLLLRSATAQGKSYSKAESEEWQVIVKTIWSLLVSQRGTVHEAAALTRQLRQTLGNHLQGEGYAVEISAFFNRIPGKANDRADNLKTLIDYVVFAASELFAEREETKRIVREERNRAREAAEPAPRRARTLLSWCPEVIANARLASERD
ncbi:hypothetical protein LTR56_018112 [Elasticomyces elasticus]|nr:hypothetical protein LTR56_018112 [Elasticomyces elasticus]KAK3642525.1 hypothetical protein LTR22_016060 [Elasticomyces elasticus]KAK4908870.1 hypothetical protein LTR49_022308 [Elasticomyces elasticus]KAK5748879.1 hypothetical protein LTS12_021049 [Elasticomyces elasticus]